MAAEDSNETIGERGDVRRHRLVLLCQSRSRHGRGRRVHRQEGHVTTDAGLHQ